MLSVAFASGVCLAISGLAQVAAPEIAAPALPAAGVQGVVVLGLAPAAAEPAEASTPPAASTSLGSELQINLRASKLDSRFVVNDPAHGTIKPSAEGVRIHLAGGAKTPKQIGLTLPVEVRSDFEITLGYENLGVGDPPSGQGAGFAVAILAAPNADGESFRATLSRVWNQAQERNWIAERIAEKSGAMKRTEHVAPAEMARNVNFRFVREGKTLRWLVDPGRTGNFQQVHESEFPDSDITAIQVFAHNGKLNAHVNVNVVDLAVRAGKFGGGGPTVTTIDETIAGKPLAIEAGELAIESTPPRKVPLDDLLSIDLDHRIVAGASATGSTAGNKSSSGATSTDTSAGAMNVSLVFSSGDRLQGELLDATADKIKLRTTWQAEVVVPVGQLSGVEFTAAASKPAASANVEAADTAAKSDEQKPAADSAVDVWKLELAQPGEGDKVVVRARDGALATVTGSVQGIRAGKLELLFEGQTRNIDAGRLVGVVFAARPAQRNAPGPYQRLHLVDGQRISGQWVAIADDQFELALPWSERLQVPTAIVKEVTAHNGRMVPLSTLEPATIEQVPYFGRVRPWQRNQSLTSGPLRVGDQTFAKGIAVHARTVLTYAIDGQFAQFRSTVGFDAVAGKRGRVGCRVLGDGRELFVDADLRADEPAAVLDLPIVGVANLTLEIDFGADEDAGDDVIWGDPRLYRQPPAKPAP